MIQKIASCGPFRSNRWLSAVRSYIPAEVTRGGWWISCGKLVTQAAQLSQLVILARILAPEDFGKMGIITVLLGGVESVTEPGLNAALIQRPGDIRPYLDTVFSLSAIRGLGLSILVLLLARAATNFWNVGEAVRVVQVMALLLLIRGLTNPATVHFTKDLNFRSIFYWNLCEVSAGLIAAVVVALLFRNVWALAASVLAAQSAKTGVSYLIHPYRPRFALDWTKAKELSGFGRWVFGTNLVTFLGLQGDSAVIGKLLGVGSLGSYQMAFRLSAIPRSTIVDPVAQVAFPLLSRQQFDRKVLKATYDRLFWATALLCGAFLLIALVWTEPLIRVILGAKWLHMIHAFRFVAVGNFFRSLAVLPGFLFYAVGRPRTAFYLPLVRMIAMAVLIYPLVATNGLRGAGMCMIVSSAAMIPVWGTAVRRAFRRASVNCDSKPCDMVGAEL